MFVFYDTETTGINIAFDQVLQFAAVLTDNNFNEIERFEIRCRLLPWVVPSPVALIVTKTSPGTLCDEVLPNFFEMMGSVRKKLDSWSPAIFIGYNSMVFDEPLLQRAFWQTLNPPYLSVTNNNTRSDLLPIIRAVSTFYPEALKWPKREDGKITFKLDRLAPFNGFDHAKAHDALGDVEATIFIAKLISERCPLLWSTLTERTSKKSVMDLISSGEPLLVFESQGGRSAAWFGKAIDGASNGASLIAKLSYDWPGALKNIDDVKTLSEAQRNVRKIEPNKAPILFSLPEALKLFNLKPSDYEVQSARSLSRRDEKMNNALEKIRPETTVWPKSEELELMIFDGFPSKNDAKIMESFQAKDWSERLQLARSFEDKRYYHLALRLIYLSAPELLSPDELERIKIAILQRLKADVDAPHPWRSIPDALVELGDSKIQQMASHEVLRELHNWFGRRINDMGFASD